MFSVIGRRALCNVTFHVRNSIEVTVKSRVALMLFGQLDSNLFSVFEYSIGERRPNGHDYEDASAVDVASQQAS
jgi:hypothetical protein